MVKIGIVSGAIDVDPTSQELLERAKDRADAKPIDPADFRVVGECFYARGERVDRYDALIVRLLNPEGDSDFQFDYLDQLSKRGVYVLNSLPSLAVAESKFLSSAVLSRAGFPVPEFAVVQRAEDAISFVERHRDVVAKPLYGFQGRDVVRVRAGDDEAIKKISRLIGDYRGILVQPFVPNPGRDIRAFVVGDRVVAAIFRIAPPGDWKTNVFFGGRVEKAKLRSDAEELSIRAAKAIGLEYTGVDLIEGPDGLLVLEVNGAPAWSGLERATGKDIARSIVDLVLQKVG